MLDGEDLKQYKEMILFKDVTFIYDGKPLMTHFSDEVSSGEKVVVYGASGTGKVLY